MPSRIPHLRDMGQTDWSETPAPWAASNACIAFLTGPDPSRNADLVDEVEVVDERARALVKDLIQRVDTLESVLKPLRPDLFS